MKRNILAIIALLTLFCTACHKETFEDRVAKEVEYFNHNEAPKRQDPISVFDSMSFDRSTLTISYFYTVEGDGEALFPTDLMQDNVLKNLRSSLQLKEHKEHGCNFRYVYHGASNGASLLDVTFSPKDYK